MRRFEKLAGLFLLLPFVAAWFGSSGPRIIDFNLGPGAAPYLDGFLPAYEIDDKLATHWTSYDASITLPLRVEGGPIDVSYRYARVFGETATVEIDLNEATLDRFSRRGGAFDERRATLAAVQADQAVRAPLTLAIRADSHERQNMGIKLDWVRFELGERASVRLSGWAFWQPLGITLIVFLLWSATGAHWTRSATLTVPLALALALGLASDPWLVHRLGRGLIVALPLFGLAVLGVGRAFRIERGTLRVVFGFMLLAFLVRATLANHPGFYYPDLRTHARLVGFVHDSGLDFLVSPSKVIAEHNVWVTGAFGETYAFPYTPAFHVPFAVLDLPYDTLILALKLAAAAVSTVPIALVWAFARRFRFSAPVHVVGAVLMVAIPTYSSRLSFAFLPSLFGHAVDMALIYWLFVFFPRLDQGRSWLAGAALVASSQLAYVSGVINISLFVAILALATFLFGGERRRQLAFRVLVMGAVGSLIAFVVFYRDFLPMVIDLVTRMLGGVAGAESRYPVTGFFETTAKRSYEFFGPAYPVLTIIGVVVVFARNVPRLVISAWLLTYFALLLGRSKVPDIFLHGHETLFLTPLVCMMSAIALAELWESGGARRVAGAAIVVALSAIGLWQQWGYFADQLANAL